VTSPFNWRTGAQSIFYTAAGHRAAQSHAQAAGGKALDTQGRPLIDMAPRSAQAITIGKQADTDKFQRIARGTSR
jgi:hypothetical protein